MPRGIQPWILKCESRIVECTRNSMEKCTFAVQFLFAQLLYLSIFYTWTTFGVPLRIRNSLWMMLRSGSSRHAILYVHNFQCLNCIFMAFSSVRNHKSCVLWFANDEKIVWPKCYVGTTLINQSCDLLGTELSQHGWTHVRHTPDE